MKMLLPLDGSESSLLAVRHAIRLVREGLDASFVLANVQEPTHLYELMMTRDAAVVEEASAAAGAHALQAGAALLAEAGIACESEVATGDPSHMLVDILERYQCDAVIMSARGAGTLRAALMGSVSEALLHASPVPVTIVKADVVTEAPASQDEDE
ncbi:MAG: universal stress protein [Proteobacteria bacterium]|nr:universal stress protein [Pseudomonadota bacterium]